MMSQMTPEDVIKRIAEIAADVAWQAGVGSMETAGLFVSVLATHPEKVSAFLAGETRPVDDAVLLNAEMGCLSWHARNGEIVTPALFRANRQQPDH